ncbi:uncharacterized protein UTRI_05588 [Ustilago trichophora]|uniref:Uncharacterized protein n=1 Tax=Ustilago trichophora TaxID=86804 RepID=A0A5C3EJF5_9BASI|nr:uncharacterized protein UTRI_05588 [Ustilago trichophora]
MSDRDYDEGCVSLIVSLDCYIQQDLGAPLVPRGRIVNRTLGQGRVSLALAVKREGTKRVSDQRWSSPNVKGQSVWCWFGVVGCWGSRSKRGGRRQIEKEVVAGTDEKMEVQAERRE